MSSLEKCRHYLLNSSTNWYEHHPKPAAGGRDVSILWDFPFNTNRTIQVNRPDIVIKKPYLSPH